MNEKIGCSGWAYGEWKPLFYPENVPSSHYFDIYAQHFNTVEVNSTFYHVPQQRTLEKWYKQSPDHFKYSIKVNRTITHIQRFHDVLDLVKSYYKIGQVLKEKLGCFLFQFPPSFHYTSENLENILKQMDSHQPNVIEFRHKSWWNQDVYDALQSHNAVFCTVSGLNVPNDLIVLNKRAYLRMHGDPTYFKPYTRQELKHLSTQIHEQDIDDIWIYFNNTRQNAAHQSAQMLIKMLKEF